MSLDNLAEVVSGDSAVIPVQLWNPANEVKSAVGLSLEVKMFKVGTGDVIADTASLIKGGGLEWAATTPFVAGQWVTTSSGYAAVCKTGGTTDASEPSWGTTVDADIVDGSVTWTLKQPGFARKNDGSDGKMILQFDPTETTNLSGMFYFECIAQDTVPTEAPFSVAGSGYINVVEDLYTA